MIFSINPSNFESVEALTLRPLPGVELKALVSEAIRISKKNGDVTISFELTNGGYATVDGTMDIEESVKEIERYQARGTQSALAYGGPLD